jgi:hypothetical protein
VHQHRQGMIDIFFGRLLEHYGASLEIVVWLGHKRGRDKLILGVSCRSAVFILG